MTLMAVVEGDTDIPVVAALAKSAGLPLIGAPIDMGGKTQLDLRLDGFNQAARGSPWFVLRDLDQDAQCAPKYLRKIGFRPSTWMAFRIAVREVEAWLMADAQGLATFLHVPERRVPADPDAEADPTRTLVNLARGSTRQSIRKAIVPKPGGSAQVGPLYEATIIEFAASHWSLDRACERSPSLERTRRALERLARRWERQVGSTG